MMRRVSTTVAAASMLLVALFGGTAFAQDGVLGPNPEGYTNEQCAIEIADFYAEFYPDWFADELAGLEGDPLTEAVADWLAENDLDFADICAIYAALPEPPEVGGIVDERPTPPATPETPPQTQTPPEPQAPPEVLGVSIARTGADTLILGVIGAILMGLGVLAVRRTRMEYGAG